MTKHSWITVGVGVLALAIACALAWWAYREAQKRELQEDVVVLVQDSTARLREALGLMTAGADARAKLEAHFAALKGSVGKARALDASVYPALVQAATAYVTEEETLLRSWGWEVELGRTPDWREQLIAEVGGRPVGFVQMIDLHVRRAAIGERCQRGFAPSTSGSASRPTWARATERR